MNTIDKTLQWHFEGKAFYQLPDGIVSSKDNAFFSEKGKAVSDEFIITESFLVFDLALYAFDDKTYAEVLIDGKREFFITGSIMGSCLKKFTLDVSRFIGKKAQFILCDAGVWERMTLKNIHMSSCEASGTMLIKPDSECVPLDITVRTSGKGFINIPVNINQSAELCCFSFDGTDKFNLFIRLAKDGSALRYASIPIEEYSADTVRIYSENIMLPKDKVEEFYKNITLTDTPVASDEFYGEIGRPKLHFTSPFGGMGDMIGFYFYNGKYNIGYLHDAGFDNWNDNATWAYSESDDLFRWKKHRTVIRKGENTRCTSGCAFIDEKNASGLKCTDDAPILLFYGLESQHGQRYQDFSECDTECTHKEHLTGISVKYSTDGGKSFEDYKNNPLFYTCAIGGHDPEVFYFAEKNKYIMVLHDKRCGKWGFDFYASESLLEWTYMSTVNDMWETPNMYPLALDGDENKIYYILQECNFGYLVGHFDGEKFIPQTEKTNSFKGAYAMRTFNTDRRIIMGNVVKTFSGNDGFIGSRSATLPMTVNLRSTKSGMKIFYEPVSELDALVEKKTAYHNVTAFDFNSLDIRYGLWDISIKAHNSFSLTLGEKEIFSYNSEDMSYTVCNQSGSFCESCCNIRLIIDSELISYFADGGIEAGVSDIGNTSSLQDAKITLSDNAVLDEICLKSLRSPYQQ